MTLVELTLSDSTLQAAQEGLSLEHFVAIAVANRVSASGTLDTSRGRQSAKLARRFSQLSPTFLTSSRRTTTSFGGGPPAQTMTLTDFVGYGLMK